MRTLASNGNTIPCSKGTNVIVTPRDIEVLLSIVQNQFLTTSQICEAHFPSIHRCRKRLRQLSNARYLKCYMIPRGFDTLSPEAVYWIGIAGMRILRSRGVVTHGVQVPKLSKRPGSLMFLSHTLLRNSFRIALDKSTREDSLVSLERWRHDNSITKRVLIADENTYSLIYCPIRADAHFSLKTKERSVDFFLELDNGTMPLTRLVKKLKAYHVWMQSAEHSKNPPTPTKLLIMLFSRTRAQNLLTRLARSGIANPRYLVSYVDRANLVRANVLAEQLWRLPPGSEKRTTTISQAIQEYTNGQNSPD